MLAAAVCHAILEALVPCSKADSSGQLCAYNRCASCSGSLTWQIVTVKHFYGPVGSHVEKALHLLYHCKFGVTLYAVPCTGVWT